MPLNRFLEQQFFYKRNLFMTRPLFLKELPSSVYFCANIPLALLFCFLHCRSCHNQINTNKLDYPVCKALKIPKRLFLLTIHSICWLLIIKFNVSLNEFHRGPIEGYFPSAPPMFPNSYLWPICVSITIKAPPGFRLIRRRFVLPLKTLWVNGARCCFVP